MDRGEIITELKRFFCIEELVCRHTHTRFKDKSWQFMDTELPHTLLVIRQELNIAMIINNWHRGGNFSQRGLRCNICPLVRERTLLNKIYLSAHCNGAGVDISFAGIGAEEARKKIENIADCLPYPIRMERDVNWVHLDVYDCGNGKRANYF